MPNNTKIKGRTRNVVVASLGNFLSVKVLESNIANSSSVIMAAERVGADDSRLQKVCCDPGYGITFVGATRDRFVMNADMIK